MDRGPPRLLGRKHFVERGRGAREGELLSRGTKGDGPKLGGIEGRRSAGSQKGARSRIKVSSAGRPASVANIFLIKSSRVTRVPHSSTCLTPADPISLLFLRSPLQRTLEPRILFPARMNRWEYKPTVAVALGLLAGGFACRDGRRDVTDAGNICALIFE